MIVQCGIYKIINLDTDDCYVGSSYHVTQRWYSHRYNLNSGRSHAKKLQEAWQRYGACRFKFELVEECERKDRYIREQYWINVLKPTYNTHPKAIGRTEGFRQTAEVRLKLSLANKKRWASLTPEQRADHAAKIAAANLGEKRSLLARQAMSIAAKRRFADPAVRMAHGELRRGKLMSTATKSKMSATHKALRENESEEKKVARSAKMSAALKGRGISIEARQKRLATLGDRAGLYAAKATAAWQGQHHTPESLAKMRLGQARWRASRIREGEDA